MNYNEKVELLQKVFTGLLPEIKNEYTGKVILHFKSGEIMQSDFEKICKYFTKEERKKIK